MKVIEKRKARTLRARGYSLRQIVNQLDVAKSSASVWVRDVILSDQQKKNLKRRHTRLEVIEKRRTTRLKNEAFKRQKIVEAASDQVKDISRKELFLIGTALYWGEGRKTNVVGFSNSDPRTIKIMMRFFREICGVSDSKLRGHIHIHPNLNFRKAEEFWSSVAKVPLEQFYKTYRVASKSSRNKHRNTLQYGTFEIVVCNRKLLLMILGWIEGVSRELLGT